MKNLRPALACALTVCCLVKPASAYEFENAVPLTLGMQLGGPHVQGVHIKLQGRAVDIAIALRNDSKQAQYAGFYAATPLFENLGDGEEYADKSFPELNVLQDGRQLLVSRHPRAYFLGQEITGILRKAGIGPVPSNQTHWKKLAKRPSLQNMPIKDWQAQLTYGWNARIAPNTSAQMNVRYSALPSFSLETIDDERLTRLVLQHCGDPQTLRSQLRRLAPEDTQIFAEVFDLALPFLKLQDTRVTIDRPEKSLTDKRPVAALACGFEGQLALPSDGMILSANNAISILVLSRLSGTSPDKQGMHYQVGRVAIREDEDTILVQAEQPLTLQNQPGWRAWPPLQLDESGRIYAGPHVIDPASGKRLATSQDTILLPNALEVAPTSTGYDLRHGKARCSVDYKELGAPPDRTPLEALQAYNVKLAASEKSILALVTSFLEDGQAANYRVQRIDPATCKTTAAARLGDPDLLVELGYTRRGGWWVTGSIEQTLMASKDGKRWRRIQLPAGLSSLVSSYLVDDKQIWLAAILGDMDQHPNLLVYSPNGGKSWTSLKANDPLLAKIPPGWLEGQKRKVAMPNPSSN